MNIIIVGDGKVGYELAEALTREDHDVTVVDKNAQALARADEALDVMCVQGNGANARTLMEAGVDQADIVIAVTALDEINMVCSLMAKQLGAKYVISRIRDPGYTDSLSLLQKEMGIDMVINPERAAAYDISQQFRYPFAINVELFAHGRVELVEFKVDEHDPIVGVPVKDLNARFPGVLYVVAERDDAVVIPGGDYVIRPGDKLHVAGDLSSITLFFKRLGRNTHRVKRALIIGGGHIAYYLAKIVAGMNLDLRIVEINEEKCRALSEQLEDVSIVCGDGTDHELLLAEDLTEMDALVCLTDRDEENLMTGLFGLHERVPKVVVKVNRLNYLQLLKGMGIDSVISPKRTTANAILRQVRARENARDSRIEKVHQIVDGRIEALEFTALTGAPYLNVPLRSLKIPAGVLVAVLVRGRKVIIPFGHDHIEAGDTVIVMAQASRITSLEDALKG